MSDLVVKDKSILAMLHEDVTIGVEDLGDGGKLPMIKITHPMALTKDKDAYLLSSGARADMDMFYHTELKEQFEEVKVHLTYVGEYQLPSYEDKTKIKMTYVIGGILQSDNSPFVAFVKGMSLQSIWDFNNEIINVRNRYKLPMYCLKITLKTDKRNSKDFGEATVWRFEIERDKNGVPVIEQDAGKLTFLKDSIEMFREKIKQMVNSEDTTPPYTEEANTYVNDTKEA